MASIVTLTTIVIVVVLASVNSEQKPYLRYSNYLQKAIPHHWQHDKEDFGGRVDTVARWHKVRGEEPPLPPLRPHQAVPWQLWTRGRLASGRLQNKEAKEIRKRLLKEKLSLNNLRRQGVIPAQARPRHDAKPRHKREAGGTQQADLNLRNKRETIINPQLQPETVMQPHFQPAMAEDTEAQKASPSLSLHFYNPSIYYPEVIDSLHNRSDPYQEKIKKNRDKRQVLYLINQAPQVQLRPARTTPNPFIRQTNIEDYEIGPQQLPERPPPPPQDPVEAETVTGSDLDSSYLLSENVLCEITRNLLNLESWLKKKMQSENLSLTGAKTVRAKRSPKMSKLHKRQKLAKKKRKKKKQKELSPRQIKHYRRIRESKERRRRVLHKKLKEKRRLRHKKMGTGPYNKTIIDYYGVYFDPPSSQLNESLYDSIYDSSALDSDKMYEEKMKEYPESGEEDSEGGSGSQGGSKGDDNKGTTDTEKSADSMKTEKKVERESKSRNNLQNQRTTVNKFSRVKLRAKKRVILRNPETNPMKSDKINSINNPNPRKLGAKEGINSMQNVIADRNTKISNVQIHLNKNINSAFHKQINKNSLTKANENFDSRLKNKILSTNKNVPLEINVKQMQSQNIKYDSKLGLINTIFDNNPKYNDPYKAENNLVAYSPAHSPKTLLRTKTGLKDVSYETIIPILNKPLHYSRI